MKKRLPILCAAVLLLGSAACVFPGKNIIEIRNDDGSRVVKTLSQDGTSRTEIRYRSDNSVAYEKTYLGMTQGARPQSAIVKDGSGRVTMSEHYRYNAAGRLQQLDTLNGQGETVVVMHYTYSADGKYTDHQHTDRSGNALTQEQVEAIWTTLEPK